MTDSDAKEWVTVKVPKEVRDDASDDPRTYGDIMQAGLGEERNPVAHVEPSVDITPEVLAEALDTSMKFPVAISEQLDRIESAQAHTVSEALELAEEDDLREQLDRIESAASTAEERTGELQSTLEDMGARR